MEEGTRSEREEKLRAQLLEWRKLLEVDEEAYPEITFLVLNNIGRRGALDSSKWLKTLRAELAGANMAAGPAIREMKEKWEACAQELAAVKRALEEQDERERKRFEAEGFDPTEGDWEAWAYAAYERARDRKCSSVEVAFTTFSELSTHLTASKGAEKIRLDLEDHNEMAADEIESLKDKLSEVSKERDAAMFHIARLVLREAKKPRRVVSLHRTPAADEAPDETPPAEPERRLNDEGIEVRIRPPKTHAFERNSSGTGLCDRCGLSEMNGVHAVEEPSPVAAPAKRCAYHADQFEPCQVCKDIPF